MPNMVGISRVARYGANLVNIVYVVAVILCVAVIFAFWIYSLQPTTFFEQSATNSAVFEDFIKTYVLGKLILIGQGYRAYDPAVQVEYFHQVAPLSHLSVSDYINYVPFFGAIMAPLASLPLVSAFALWSVGTRLFGLLALVALKRELAQSLPWSHFVVIVLLYLSSTFSGVDLLLGQTGWINMALLCLYFAWFMRGDEIKAGICLALGTFKPQYLLLTAIPALVQRRYRLLMVSFLAELFLLGLSIVTVGYTNVLNYPHNLLWAEKKYVSNCAVEMVSLMALVWEALRGQSTIIGISLFFLGVALTAYLWKKAQTRDDQIRAIALSCMVYLAFSLHAFLYDALVWVIPTILTVKRCDLASITEEQSAAQKIWTLVLLAAPLFLWGVYLHSPLMASRWFVFINAVMLTLGLFIEKRRLHPSRE
jgi:hypothetical protein